MTGRTVTEWIGSSPDAKVPARVRIRIFERHGGRCHISGRLIRAGEPWDLDHIIALTNGGEHREFNMAPALRDKHKVKTAQDVREKSIVARKKSKYLGVYQERPRQKIQSPGFRKADPQNSATRELRKHTASKPASTSYGFKPRFPLPEADVSARSEEYSSQRSGHDHD